MKIITTLLVVLLFYHTFSIKTNLKHGNSQDSVLSNTGAFLTEVNKNQQVGLIDLAKGGKTTSSKAAYKTSSGHPVRANKSPMFQWEHGSCFHSGNDRKAWWHVKLATPGYIDQIHILNRQDGSTDRLQQFEVLVDNKVCYTQSKAAGARVEVKSCKKFGKSVTIRFNSKRAQNNQTYLQLCGVTVLGSPTLKKDCGYIDVAEKAVIKTSPTYQNGKTSRKPLKASTATHNCWHSTHDKNAYYTATFNEPVDIGQLMIRNRSSCCHQRLNNWQIKADGKQCFESKKAALAGEEIFVNSCNGLAKEVQISYTGNRNNHQPFLTICGLDIIANTKCTKDCVIFYSKCDFQGDKQELCSNNEKFNFIMGSVSIPAGLAVTVFNVMGNEGKPAKLTSSVECFEGDINSQFLQVNGIYIDE